MHSLVPGFCRSAQCFCYSIDVVTLVRIPQLVYLLTTEGLLWCLQSGTVVSKASTVLLNSLEWEDREELGEGHRLPGVTDTCITLIVLVASQVDRWSKLIKP